MGLNEDKFLAQLLETFRSEAQEHLTAIASGLLTLEQGSLSNEEYNRVIEQIFRDTHSLKGAARAVGLREIETLCQQQESVFSAVKKGNLIINPDSFDLFHAVIHAVEQLLSQDTGVKTADLIQQLKALMAADTVSFPIQNHESRVQPDTQSSISGSVQDDISETKNPEHMQYTKPGDSKNGASSGLQVPEYILHNTNDEKNPIESEPGFGKREGSGSIKTSPMVKISSERLEDLFSRADDLIGARLASSQRSSSIRDLLQNFLSWRWAWTQITTDIEHLRTDTFQNGIGSHITHLSEIERIAGFLEYNHTFIHSLERELTAISRAVARDQYLLDTATTELIDEIKQVILVPASSLLEMYPRAARDLAKEKGKNVDVLLSGAEIEIDRRILEEIRDPILHIIRNSIDHGIESSDIRKERGKPERGTIHIT
ncbi:MAG: Hpt domain-containing protein, partial [Methanospirillum sp.]|uniref:Hpt domain-containing protein n=1 Tax=Methanospirillum sp. TaxID=45200 RepID=UPI00236F8FC2